MDEEVKKPTEKFSEALQTKFLSLKDYLITETGVLFTKKELAGQSGDAVKKLYRDRLANSELYDYAFAKSTGVARRHKDQASLKSEANEIIKRDKNKIDVILFIRVASAIISIVASVVLFSYTSEYFSKSNTAFRSNAFAAIILSFNILAFDLVVLFFMMKMRALAWSMIALLLVTIPFSMFATVDVSYTNYFSSQAQDVNVAVEASADLLSVQKDALKTKLEAMNAAIRVRDAAALDPSTPQWYLSQLSTAVTKSTNDYNSFYEDFKKNLSATPEAASSQTTKSLKKDLFNAIEDAWGIPRFKSYFVVNTLPAVFLDIIAPLMAAIAMFLGGKRDGREDGI